MKRMTYKELVAEAAPFVPELFPWDVSEARQQGRAFLLLDVRCPSEFDEMHIAGSLNVPRGILETACDYGYDETEPELVAARERPVLVICRSGNRSILAAHTLQRMGYADVASLKTGLRGWNDYELPLTSRAGRLVPVEEAELFFTSSLTTAQRGPGAGMGLPGG